MKTPFRIALELAWSDGSMSKRGAMMLEQLGDAFDLSAQDRALVEDEFVAEELSDRIDRGSGTGADLLHPWLEQTLSELAREDIGAQIATIACAAVEAGLTKQGWKDGIRYASEMGLGDVFARAVWAEEEIHEVEGDVPQILIPLSEHLLG